VHTFSKQHGGAHSVTNGGQEFATTRVHHDMRSRRTGGPRIKSERHESLQFYRERYIYYQQGHITLTAKCNVAFPIEAPAQTWP
jgi:hypothetical protein